MIDTSKRILFLRKIHLFRDLMDDDLLHVAEKFSEETFEAGGAILEQGSSADSFYIIYSGKVRVFLRREGREQDLAVMVPGDYVGEMELFSHRGRTANVVAMEPTILLRLSRATFEEFLKSYPSLKPNLELSIKSRKLARSLRFKWLRPDEVVYFLARKHSIILLRTLIAPLLAFFLPGFLFIWGYLAQSLSAMVFSGILGLVILGWGIWNVIDWGNDYYIVTNQRVVWLEKVIGIYDSRSEAPLTTILSVGVETDIIGRILDFGDVIVRTYVGAIPFRHVDHPNEAAQMVEEYWQRTKQVSVLEEKEAFKEALRERLGLTPPPEPETDDNQPEDDEDNFPRTYRPGIFQVIGANLFKMRYEEGGTITYRKHWFVLISHIWAPTLILMAFLGLLIMRVISLAGNPGFAFHLLIADTVVISLPLIMIPFIGWWIYQYMDWSNDVFRVTSDQILDIDRTPFGTEERRSAPLDNILSTEYKREGLAGYLFNYGTVFITVGGAQLAFEDVLDPAGVQSDIDSRRMARIAAKKDSEQSAERDRMAEWMATYHRNLDEFREEQELNDTNQKNE